MRIMRNVLGSVGLTAALALGITLTPAAAAAPAATPPAASPAVASPVSASQQFGTLGNMEFYDDFWTFAECDRFGRSGMSKGKWWDYDCQESWLDWDLYVAYY
ncbi:hypothetical protein PV721_29820 [Streptomyces sp. MB09-01]|uniref:hypothetical protein n=1 Tax=Streptomyces sp. MB09-01 TaxID=3028666 RepID=UPI0029A43125|nr:hypothetical protein [Streptomyces sp. MB09-01]MDX3538471.1 hypothetical protein [Streptomyces sp. MB09-01]